MCSNTTTIVENFNFRIVMGEPLKLKPSNYACRVQSHMPDLYRDFVKNLKSIYDEYELKGRKGLLVCRLSDKTWRVIGQTYVSMVLYDCGFSFVELKASDLVKSNGDVIKDPRIKDMNIVAVLDTSLNTNS